MILNGWRLWPKAWRIDGYPDVMLLEEINFLASEHRRGDSSVYEWDADSGRPRPVQRWTQPLSLSHPDYETPRGAP